MSASEQLGIEPEAWPTTVRAEGIGTALHTLRRLVADRPEVYGETVSPLDTPEAVRLIKIHERTKEIRIELQEHFDTYFGSGYEVVVTDHLVDPKNPLASEVRRTLGVINDTPRGGFVLNADYDPATGLQYFPGRRLTPPDYLEELITKRLA